MLQAGAAMVDITPKAGTHLSGSGRGEHRPAESILDPLYGRVVVFESGGEKVCLIGLDLCMVSEEFTDLVRAAAAKRCGIHPEAVMVHAVQSHSAPSCGRFMLDPDFPLELTPENEYLTGSQAEYEQFARERIIEGLEAANGLLEPVRIAAASAVQHRLAFNRRGVTREGMVTMPWPVGHRAQPFGPTNVLYMEGPIDPEMGVFCARTQDMRMLAMLLHYTCHPVNVFGNKDTYHAVSSDWPGVWAAGMQEAYGEGCVPVVLNGCCGNINPWDPFDPEFVPDHRRMGNALSRVGRRLAASMRFKESDTLEWALRHVPLEYRWVPEQRQQEVERILWESPGPKWLEEQPDRVDPAWMLAASTKSVEYCRRRMPQFRYQVQVFRIGDVAIVGLPGEPFVEGQLQIKLQSPAEHTYLAHCTSHYAGYLPTVEAYQRGGHEANPQVTYWSKLAPGSLETVTEQAVEMLEELF